MKQSFLFLVLVFMLPMLSVASSAEGTYTLPQINVIGESDQELLTTPSSANYIEHADLEEMQPISLQEAVSKTPGVHVVDTEGQGFLPRIGLRGLNPDMSKKVLLLEDGVPINLGPFTDPASYYNPPIERMERIEVLKGSSSLRYGPSTIGGAINFITKDPKDISNNYSLFGGNLGLMGVRLEGAKSSENSAMSISVGKRTGDGNRENNKFDMTDVVIKFGMLLNDSHHVGAKVSYYNNDMQATYLGLTDKMYRADAYQNPAKNDEMEIRRLALDLNHTWSITETIQLQTLVYSNTTRRDWWRENFTLVNGDTEIQMSGTTSGRLRTFDNIGLDTRLTWDNKLFNQKNKTEVGVRLHDEEMKNQRVNGVTATTRSGTLHDDEKRLASAQAMYLQNTITLGNFDLTPGVRVESYKQERKIYRIGGADLEKSSTVTNTEVMPGLGGVYLINENTSTFFGVHRGFSPPRVEDAIDATGAAVDLEAERSTNIELGLRHKSSDLSYDIALFQLDFDNQLIQSSEAGGAAAQLTNAGKSLHQGAEASAEVRLKGSVYLGTSWTYVPVAKLNGTRIIGGQDRNGNRLPYAPENIGNLSLGMRTSSWSTEISVQYVSEQYSDFQNTRAGSANGRTGIIPEYTTVNLAGRVNLSKDYQLFGNVKNLMDETYISSRAPQGIFAGLQRSFTLGINGQF